MSAATLAQSRRDLTRRARHIAPWLLLAGLIAAALAAASPVERSTLAEASGGLAAPAAPGTDGSVSADGAVPGSAPGGPGAAAPGVGATPGGSPAPTGAPPVGIGTSVAGVDCASGRRQLATSAYGAACQGASDGTNPGATAAGVTADTITVTLRISSSGASAALLATAGTAADSLGGNQGEVAADMAKLVGHFNKVFDLYGREVVLKVFDGQGDFLAEFQNQNVQGAQADAARARDQHTFADVSIVTQTQPYSEALISQKIIALSPVYLSDTWYEDHAPYAYGVLWPVGTQVGQFMGNVACQRLAGGDAAFAGDDATRGAPRVFGIIHPENPEFARVGDMVDRALRRCGHAPARRIAYALNIATLQNEQTNAVAQMKAAGVTTVLCACDEFSPIFITRAAEQQQYRPEWLQVWWPDPWQRLAAAPQWSRSMHTGGTAPDYMAGEVGATWKAAAGGARPEATAALPLVHQQLLALFSALQAAGPNLTPATFQQGFASLAGTPAGDFGPWSFGAGAHAARSQFQLGWYDPAARSSFDGQAGAIRGCLGGRFFRFDDAAGLGSGPLDCFAR